MLCFPLTLDQYRSQACPNDYLRIQTARRSSTPANCPDVAHRDVGDWIRSPVAIVGIRCDFSGEIDGSGVLVELCECEVVRICACLICGRGHYIVVDLLTVRTFGEFVYRACSVLCIHQGYYYGTYENV